MQRHGRASLVFTFVKSTALSLLLVSLGASPATQMPGQDDPGPSGCACGGAGAGEQGPQQAGGPQKQGVRHVPPDDAEVRLDRLFYRPGEFLSATLRLEPPHAVPQQGFHLAITGAITKDFELLRLEPTADPRFFQSPPLPIELSRQPGDVRPVDGRLMVRPGELIVALYGLVGDEAKIPDRREDRPPADLRIVADIGIVEDPEFRGVPVHVEPRIAMTDDERQVPVGGKRIGTMAVAGGLAVQIPLDEVMIRPRARRSSADSSGRPAAP